MTDGKDFCSGRCDQSQSELLNGTVDLDDPGYSVSDDVTEAGWSGNGSDGWVKNLAVSITNVIREDPQANRTMFDGTASVQGVKTQWWWISLPAAAVVISIVPVRSALVSDPYPRV